jgi:hypothetical protein
MQKKHFLLLAFLLGLAGCRMFKHEVQASNPLDASHMPVPALVELLSKTGIKHDGTLADIVTQTQKQQPDGWIRPAGSERFNMVDMYVERKDELRPLFQRVGLLDEVKPKQKSYDYGIVHGATILGMRVRLAYLIKLWQEGVRFGKLIFLVGQRDLDPTAEPVASFDDRMQTVLPLRPDWKIDTSCFPVVESDAAKMLYDQALMPDELRALPMEIVDAPKTRNADGVLVRPTTRGTVETWLLSSPKPGSCLAVTNQPFVGYQDATVRGMLPVGFTLETVGGAINAAYESVAMWFDSLARWLYAEQKLKLA